MCTYHFLPVRLFSNCSKVCGTKLFKLTIINRQALRSVYSIPAILTRSLSFPPLHSNALVRRQYLHLWRCTQIKPMWPGTAAYSSSANIENEPESNLIESPARPRRNLMTNPFKKDRIENQTLLREIIAKKGDTDWTADDWAQLVESLPLPNQSMWEVICMHTLYLDKNISLARKLMMHLESQTTTPSLIVFTFYIGLLGETCNGSEDQENETYKYYQLLLSSTDVLDAGSIEVLISGLSMTKYYLEILKLLKICQETSNINPSSLIQLFRAGVRNKDMKICKFALTQFDESIEPTSFNMFAPAVINECLAVSNQDGLEMTMNFIQKHHILLPKTVLEEIIESFYRHQPNQWVAKYGFINYKSGQCNVCRHQMERSGISDADFKAIQSAFLKQVIVGSNVFFKTSPDEVDNFITFIEKTGPFDVVIDGLNVLYKGSNKIDNSMLNKLVEYYISNGKKILILGSRMLNRYITKIKTIVPKPMIYMTSTSKADDAFFLYAALHSGKNTLIVSSDKLRDHKFLLDPSLRHIFHKWVLTSQVYDWYLTQSGAFGIGKRHLYLLGPAQDEGGWHIPMNDIDHLNPFGKFGVLCLRNKAKWTARKVDTGYRCSKTEKLEQVVSTMSYRPINQTKAADSYNQPAESQTTRPAENQTRPAVKGENKNLAVHSKDSATSVEFPKKLDRKLQQSKNVKLKSEKEWFDL